MRLINIAPLVLTALLAACGGDDDHGITPTYPSPMSGAWQTSTSDGSTLNALILDDGKMWAVGIRNDYPSYQLTAQTYADGGRFDADGVRLFDYLQDSLIGGDLEGNHQPGSYINADLWLDGYRDKSSYTFRPMPTSMFNYHRPAYLSDISGSWRSEGLKVAIDRDGTFDMSGDTSCRASGYVSPHRSHKNVFTLNATLSGQFCTFSGADFEGIAVVWNNNGQDELMVTALSLSRNTTLSLSILSLRD